MHTIITAIFLILFGQIERTELLEFQLIDKLGEPRGCCIDIKGPKKRSKLKQVFQAHTCYSYQGQL